MAHHLLPFFYSRIEELRFQTKTPLFEIRSDLAGADGVDADAERREIADGWVSIADGLIHSVGQGEPPTGDQVVDASGCLVTPGLINAHHHLFQNLTRAFPPMTDKPLFGWLQSLYPLWAAIDTEEGYVSAWVGLAELARSGCTTSTDHLYLHPKGAGDLLGAEIDAARDLGMRFHPTRGSMSLSEKDGGLPPDSVVADDDEILAAIPALAQGCGVFAEPAAAAPWAAAKRLAEEGRIGEDECVVLLITGNGLKDVTAIPVGEPVLVDADQASVRAAI